MRQNKGHQAGNVFTFILLGVVLFAALMFAVSRGLNTGTSTLAASQARNQAIDIINYGQQVDRAVARLLEQGVSESDLSFENDTVTGYAHIPVVTATAKVFAQADNLGALWRAPDQAATAHGNNQWVYAANWIVPGLGSDSRSELAMYLFVKRDVCAEINKQLGLSIDLSSSLATPITLTKFTGTYADNVINKFVTTVKETGCYAASGSEGTQTGSYVFAHVLLSR